MLSDKGYLIHVGGRSHTAYATHEPTGLRLTLDGQTCVFSKEYDPTRLTTVRAVAFQSPPNLWRARLYFF